MQLLDNKEYNYFHRVDLSDEEQKAGTVLSHLNKQLIQNIISRIAVDILRVPTDLDKPLQAEIQRSYLKGQIDAYKYLLDLETYIEENEETSK